MDFDPPNPSSDLGKLLLSSDRMEVMIQMAEAGRRRRRQ